MGGKTWTIEMFWRCKHCQTVCPGMSGNERESLRCTSCGAEKTDEPWLMPDDVEHAPALSGEQDRKARAGANWTCVYCKAQSRTSSKACEVCGAARDKPAEAPRPARKAPSPRPKAAPEPAVASSPYRPLPPASLFEEDFVPVRSWTPPKELFLWILGLLALAGVVWLAIWLSQPHHTVAQVRDVMWTRTQRLEERHSYGGEGWRAQAPNGVYAWDYCTERQNGTRDCNPHDCNCRLESYECHCTGGTSYSCGCRTSCSSNRNGSATCSQSCGTCYTPRSCSTCTRTRCSTCYNQCPHYETWCRYRYYRWDELQSRTATAHDTTPYWPGVAVTAENQRVVNMENYVVWFDDTRDNRNHWDKRVDLATFQRFAIGQRWNVEWTRAGSLRVLTRETTP